MSQFLQILLKKKIIIQILLKLLIKLGFNVYIENNAGLNSGYLNSDYESSGAKIVACTLVSSNADKSSSTRSAIRTRASVLLSPS